MKNKFTLTTCLLLSLLFASAQWQPTNGPYGGQVNCEAIMGQTLFAGTAQQGVFTSTDNGNHWTVNNNGLGNWTVWALQTVGANIFAGTTDGIYLSTDNGASWSETDSGIPYPAILAMTASGNNLIAATFYDGIYLSADSGKSWNQVDAADTNSYNVNFFAVIGNVVVAWTWNIDSVNNILLRSEDNGANWAEAGQTGLPSISNFEGDVECMASSGTKMYAGTAGNGSGVYLSADSGTTWTSINNGQPDSFVTNIAVSGNNIIAGAYTGIYVSSNNGATWTQVSDIFPLYNTFLASGDTVLAGGASVYESLNSGASWSAITGNLTACTYSSILAADNNIFTGTDVGVYSTANNGVNWTALNHGFNNFTVSTLAAEGNYIVAGGPGALFTSANNGLTWTPADSGISDLFYLDITSLGVSGKNIFAGLYQNGVFLSTDNGVSWTQVNNGLTDTAIVAIAAIGSDIFVSTFSDGIFLSTNNGESWAPVNNELGDESSNLLAVSGSNLFAGEYDGIFMTTDSGSSWIQCADNNLPDDNIVQLTANTYAVFAALPEGIYYSVDSGNNWFPLNAGLADSSSVTALGLSNTYLFAGASGSVVWKFPLSDIATGIKNVSDNQQVSIYPNPASGYISIAANKTGENAGYTIYDVTGNKISTGILTGAPSQIDVSPLPAGMYFIAVNSGQEAVTKKFVVQR